MQIPTQIYRRQDRENRGLACGLALEDEMSNRKPFNDRAGYVASRKNIITGIHNVIYIASEQGIDVGYHKYVTVCEAHQAMIGSTSVPNARIDMKNASQWCERCRQMSH